MRVISLEIGAYLQFNKREASVFGIQRRYGVATKWQQNNHS